MIKTRLDHKAESALIDYVRTIRSIDQMDELMKFTSRIDDITGEIERAVALRRHQLVSQDCNHHEHHERRHCDTGSD